MFLDPLKSILGMDSITDKEKLDLAQRETQRIIAAEKAMEYERLKKLHIRFEAVDVGAPFPGQFFSEEKTINLAKKRDDVCIYNRPFKSFVVTELYPKLAVSPHSWGLMPPIAYVRLNQKASPKYKLRHGEIRGDFSRIYLTNAAQVGCSFTYVIGVSEFAHYGMRGDTTAFIEALELLKGITTKRTLADLYSIIEDGPKSVDTPTPFNVTMTNADTEYTITLPLLTRRFLVHTRDESEFRYAYVAGKVAAPTEPYFTVLANSSLYEPDLLLGTTPLYVAAPVAGKVAECMTWK